MEKIAVRGENALDEILFQTGVVLAILGIAGAGVAVIRAILMKWWATLAMFFGF